MPSRLMDWLLMVINRLQVFATYYNCLHSFMSDNCVLWLWLTGKGKLCSFQCPPACLWTRKTYKVFISHSVHVCTKITLWNFHWKKWCNNFEPHRPQGRSHCWVCWVSSYALARCVSSSMDFRFYHTIFLDFIVILFKPCYSLSAAVHQFVGGTIQIFLIDWLIDSNNISGSVESYLAG